MAAGRIIRVTRWLSRADRAVPEFADAFGLNEMKLGTLSGIRSPENKKTAFFGHPLWRVDSLFYNNEQAEAEAIAVRAGATSVRAFDLYTLIRQPLKVFSWLISEGD